MTENSEDQIIVLTEVSMPKEPHPLAELVYTRLKDWVINLGEIPWDNVPPFKELDAEEREILNRCGGRIAGLIADKYLEDTQTITSPELNQLWAVIGEAGCRLKIHERAGLIAGLNFHATYGIGPFYASLPKGFRLDESQGFDLDALDDLELSPADCWQAIADIAAAQLANERGSDER
ncbi:MAG: hypothetical protein KME19_08905 [Microcoleus vaginatus WJT46-NPBG5]|jgi:hypothetical protein|nr:hypothetical protein [Microcoleus vaginatus WJT46-NPBG5]MBW4680219.1 hypothetical protein [Microcoleus vaginatus WJT46-NPBG5]